MNLFLCKFIYFNCYLFSCFSSYLHVFISYERWYAVSNPIKSKTNPLNNKKIILIIFIVCVLFSSPYIYFAQMKSLFGPNSKNNINLQCINVSLHCLNVRSQCFNGCLQCFKAPCIKININLQCFKAYLQCFSEYLQCFNEYLRCFNGW